MKLSPLNFLALWILVSRMFSSLMTFPEATIEQLCLLVRHMKNRCPYWERASIIAHIRVTREARCLQPQDAGLYSGCAQEKDLKPLGLMARASSKACKSAVDEASFGSFQSLSIVVNRVWVSA